MSNCLQELTKTEVTEASEVKAESRPTSVADESSNASKRPRDSSVFQLIVTPKDKQLAKCCTLYGFKRVFSSLVVFLLVVVLCTMTGLYITQKRELTQIESFKSKRKVN